MTTHQYYAVYSPSWEPNARLRTILRCPVGEDPELDEKCLGNGGTWRHSTFLLEEGRGEGTARIEKVTRAEARDLIKKERTLAQFFLLPLDLW